MRHTSTVGILVALLNSTTLVLISLGIFYEAYQRFITLPEVQSGILIGVGLIAVVINLVTALLVRRGSQSDLNLRSAFVHLMGDVISTVGAVIAADSPAESRKRRPRHRLLHSIPHLGLLAATQQSYWRSVGR